MSFPSNGDYIIQNAKYGTFLDLSANDHTTVSGWSYKNVPNQKWTLKNLDGKVDQTAWIIRSKDPNAKSAILKANGSSTGQTITVGSEAGWNFWHIMPIDVLKAANVCQIYLPNSSPGQLVELKDGQSANGGIIQLNSNTYSLHQLWVFHKIQ